MQKPSQGKHSYQEHKERARSSVNCGVVTVSDTRTKSTDTSGQLILKLLQEAGHVTGAYHVIKDEPSEILPLLESLLAGKEVEVVIINGGTGISRRDVTYDVVSRMIEKILPGFGELFRRLSYEEIGTAAMMSRAVAGTVKGKVLISIPGSSGAVKLAMEKLILPEVAHIVYELNK